MTPTVERGLRVQICSRRGKRSDTGGDGFLLGSVMRRLGEEWGGCRMTALHIHRNCNCFKWLCGEHLQPLLRAQKRSSQCELVVPENDKPMAFRQQEVWGRREWLHRLDRKTLFQSILVTISYENQLSCIVRFVIHAYRGNSWKFLGENQQRQTRFLCFLEKMWSFKILSAKLSTLMVWWSDCAQIFRPKYKMYVF